MAPMSTVCFRTASGSSTTSRIRLVAPPIDRVERQDGRTCWPSTEKKRVHRVLRAFLADLDLALALSGHASVDEVGPEALVALV